MSFVINDTMVVKIIVGQDSRYEERKVAQSSPMMVKDHLGTVFIKKNGSYLSPGQFGMFYQALPPEHPEAVEFLRVGPL